MRFCYVVLVATVALFADSYGVSSNIAADSELVAPSNRARFLTEKTDINVAEERYLKRAESEEVEDDSERAAATGALQKLKEAVWRIKIRSWYKAAMTPKQVNTMLLSQGGKVDWALATAYASYFRNLKYGPYAIDMVNKENDENNA